MIDLWGKLPSRPSDPRIKHRRLKQITKFVVHAIDADNWAPEKLNALCTGIDATPDDFTDDLKTMRAEPYCSYHDYIRIDGSWNHLVEYDIVTWHASGHNTSAIGVALEYRPGRGVLPAHVMMEGLIEYLSIGCYALAISPHEIYGHRELLGTGFVMDGTKKRLLKECPGMLIDLDRLREDVMIHMGNNFDDLANSDNDAFYRAV